MNDREQDLLQRAVEQINNLTGVDAEVAIAEPKAGGEAWDAMLIIPRRNLKFFVEIKTGLRRGQAGAVIRQLQYYRGLEAAPVMLVADYVNPQIAQLLREGGIEYMDMAGNAHIAQDPLFIHIAGQKLKNDEIGAAQKTGRAFKTAGLKVVFALLREPETIGKTYREIAEAADVALGTVGPVLEDLEQQRYVVNLGGKDRPRRVLEDKEKLIEKWAEFYPLRLKPNLHLGEFITDKEDWWNDIDFGEIGAVMGGEFAAAEYTKYLKPVDMQIYIAKQNVNALLAKGRLRKIKLGEGDGPRVTVLQRFWPPGGKDHEQRGLADPILVYADLLETADPRNLETAERLKDLFLD